MTEDYNEIFRRVKDASRTIPSLTDRERSEILCKIAGEIEECQELLLAANQKDLDRMDRTNPLYDRLQLSPERLGSIASDMRNVASLSSPLGEEIERRTLPNGLLIRRVRVPFGVIGVIYEARPNVTFDVFSLCFKSGNACVLKGGRDAENSNEAIVSLIRRVLSGNNISPDIISLLPSTHDATGALLNAVSYVDVCIPRGGRRLIDACD